MLDTVSQELRVWINRFKRRIEALILARGSATLSLTAVCVTAAAVLLGVAQGFPRDFMILSRLILLLSLLWVGYAYLVVPKRRLQNELKDEIERLAPEFQGRVATYMEASSKPDGGGPLLGALAHDTVRLTPSNVPEQRIPGKQLVAPWVLVVVCCSFLLGVGLWGSANYSYGVRALWLGWIVPGIVPAQSILVSPGDEGVRAGGRVRVDAKTQGFSPKQAFVHARFENGDWQQVPMSIMDDGFEFTFFSVRESLEYYVAAGDIRSPTYQVEVVDVPEIENFSLTLNFPEWTGKEPEIKDPGGDVRAIGGTEVELTVTGATDLLPTVVVVDGEPIPLRVEGNQAKGDFSIRSDGEYFVAARVAGEEIRLTDDYFITLLEDTRPKLEFVRPGRDWSASAIEEVTTRLQAVDDFRVESLTLFYSINGGPWISVDLTAGEKNLEQEYVFLLESLAEQNLGLSPGDLIAYYAVAGDRENQQSTDIFFIDVQPFDRRYSQSQQAGGPPSQGGPARDEISKRQKEIIISTWNLIRESQSPDPTEDNYVLDNATLLSRLQSRLKAQVETLVARSQARLLTGNDEIATFVDHLNKAATAMEPAAERLGEIELEQAILPAQEALQHLLAAEAVFNDISVSMQANSGGGGQAGRDLAEMFEMEMDLEKNQYETGNQATPETPESTLDEAADELAELARRQERLAKQQQRQRTQTPEQRWQQQRLRRELEQLQERLEQMAAGPQSEDPEGNGEASSGSGGEAQREIENLTQRLERARRAMADAEQALQQQNQDPEATQRAMEQAQSQLTEARDSANQAQNQALQRGMQELSRDAQQLAQAQSEIEKQLQEAVTESLRSTDPLDDGLSFEEEFTLAQEKRQMLAELQSLNDSIREIADRLDDQRPGIASELRRAVDEMKRQEIETRIAIGIANILEGEAAYVASSESLITDAVEELSRELEGAENRMGAGNLVDQSNDRLQAVLDDTRRLRQNLESRRAISPTVQPNAIAQGRDDRQQSSGIEVPDLETTASLESESEEVVRGVQDLLRDSENYQLRTMDIAEIADLAAGVRAADYTGNETLLESEVTKALAIVEQLELALSRASQAQAHTVRTRVQEEVSREQQEVAAEYFRRLAETDQARTD